MKTVINCFTSHISVPALFWHKYARLSSYVNRENGKHIVCHKLACLGTISETFEICFLLCFFDASVPQSCFQLFCFDTSVRHINHETTIPPHWSIHPPIHIIQKSHTIKRATCHLPCQSQSIVSKQNRKWLVTKQLQFAYDKTITKSTISHACVKTGSRFWQNNY
jgi:hypothetical protein